MAMIEFTPHDAARSIGPNMFDEVACRHWVIAAIRSDHIECPSCGVRLTHSEVTRLMDDKSITCSACGIKSSPRSGTILEGSTLSDQQIVFILALLFWDIPVCQIATMAGCAPQTVYNWRNRLHVGDS